MAFVAYLFGLVAAFIGVLALYGVLLKPVTTKLRAPVATAAEDRHDDAPTSVHRASPHTAPHAAPVQASAPEHNEAVEARAEEHAEAPAPPPEPSSRRSPVRSEPGVGLRLKPERCWIATDSLRGYGYYGECR